MYVRMIQTQHVMDSFWTASKQLQENLRHLILFNTDDMYSTEKIILNFDEAVLPLHEAGTKLLST